ncbi:hypothetical protein [Aureibacillus halotolerans]|uniref:Uncharacterized protein n=1 Tax=Aureibacillus halotolerans TaxID=1508390 RepID=A0A4R6U2S2_9BACI|nr:hypothetical protein [Aureibacillus halotolerans]TDQ37414.1 hypothetical protein EV213_11348 [Aureibacillus halotolerans]
MRFYFTVGLGLLGVVLSVGFPELVSCDLWDGVIAGGIVDLLRGQHQTTPSSVQRYLK